MNSSQEYGISYAPPLQVKDGPHRILDTFEGWNGPSEVEAQDYGHVCEVGKRLDIKALDLPSVNVGGEVPPAG
jgi:hypothetical protein